MHRFGGPGIKKKACLRRVCYKARNRDDDEDDDDDDEPQTGQEPVTQPSTPAQREGAPAFRSSEPQSEVTSPRLRPFSPSDTSPGVASTDGEGPPAEHIGHAFLGGGPMQVSAGAVELDMLSRMASSINAA